VSGYLTGVDRWILSWAAAAHRAGSQPWQVTDRRHNPGFEAKRVRHISFGTPRGVDLLGCSQNVRPGQDLKFQRLRWWRLFWHKGCRREVKWFP